MKSRHTVHYISPFAHFGISATQPFRNHIRPWAKACSKQEQWHEKMLEKAQGSTGITFLFFSCFFLLDTCWCRYKSANNIQHDVFHQPQTFVRHVLALVTPPEEHSKQFSPTTTWLTMMLRVSLINELGLSLSSTVVRNGETETSPCTVGIHIVLPNCHDQKWQPL